MNLPASLNDWQAFEGSWVSSNEVISNLRSGRGDKLISNSPIPNDLLLSGEVRFDSASDMQWGDAGLVIRATSLSPGTDSFYGYYVGLRPVSRELLFGREEFDYINLAVQPMSEPLELGAWYRLQLRAKGCRFVAQVFDQQGEAIGRADVEDINCRSLQGAVGLRSYSILTSWRHLVVRALD